MGGTLQRLGNRFPSGAEVEKELRGRRDLDARVCIDDEFFVIVLDKDLCQLIAETVLAGGCGFRFRRDADLVLQQLLSG